MTASTAGSANAAPRSLLERTELNGAAISTIGRPFAITAGVVPLVVLTLVIGLVGNWIVGLIVGLLVGAAAGALAWVQVPKGARAKVDAVVVARDAAEDDHPRYHNLIEGLTLNSGAKRPELRVVDSPSLNLAVYGSPDEGVVVATTGLLEQLERIELEGVLAEALVRLRARDAELAMQLAANRSFGLLGVAPTDSSVTSKARAVESLAAVLADRFGPQREFLADLGAVDITRYPPGLGSAFVKMAEHGTAVESVTLGTAHLWIVDPLPTAESLGAAAEIVEPLRIPTPIGQRIMLMDEL